MALAERAQGNLRSPLTVLSGDRWIASPSHLLDVGIGGCLGSPDLICLPLGHSPAPGEERLWVT